MQSPYGLRDTEDLVVRRILRRLERYFLEIEDRMEKKDELAENVGQFEGENSGETVVSLLSNRTLVGQVDDSKSVPLSHLRVESPPTSDSKIQNVRSTGPKKTQAFEDSSFIEENTKRETTKNAAPEVPEERTLQLDVLESMSDDFRFGIPQYETELVGVGRSLNNIGNNPSVTDKPSYVGNKPPNVLPNFATSQETPTKSELRQIEQTEDSLSLGTSHADELEKVEVAQPPVVSRRPAPKPPVKSGIRNSELNVEKPPLPSVPPLIPQTSKMTHSRSAEGALQQPGLGQPQVQTPPSIQRAQASHPPQVPQTPQPPQLPQLSQTPQPPQIPQPPRSVQGNAQSKNLMQPPPQLPMLDKIKSPTSGKLTQRSAPVPAPIQKPTKEFSGRPGKVKTSSAAELSSMPLVSQAFGTGDPEKDNDIPMSQMGLEDYKPKPKLFLGLKHSFIVILVIFVTLFFIYRYLNKSGLVE